MQEPFAVAWKGRTFDVIGQGVMSKPTNEVYIIFCPSSRKLVIGVLVLKGLTGGRMTEFTLKASTDRLSKRFSRSAETWRRVRWLRMIFTRYAPSELQSGALREVMARKR